MASPGLRRGAARFPGPASCASSGAAASGSQPRPLPRAPPLREASAAAHGGACSRVGTRTRTPEPPASDRAPLGSVAAAAAPRGPVASCKGPAPHTRRPALQSHPGARGRSATPHPPRTSCASGSAGAGKDLSARSRPPPSLSTERGDRASTAAPPCGSAQWLAEGVAPPRQRARVSSRPRPLL